MLSMRVMNVELSGFNQSINQSSLLFLKKMKIAFVFQCFLHIKKSMCAKIPSYSLTSTVPMLQGTANLAAHFM